MSTCENESKPGGSSAQDYPPGVVSAADLLAKGLALCLPDPGEKKPTYPRWGTRSLEADDFPPGSLYGILTGPLSDCNRPGHALVAPDLDWLEAIARADEYLPVTAMLEGRPDKPNDHRYYLIPVETIPVWALSTAKQASAAAKRLKGHPGPFKKAFNLPDRTRVIDFMGTGGQIVCPSPGNARRWVGGVPGEPAVVPFTELWEAVKQLARECGAEMPKTGEAKAGRSRARAEPGRNGDTTDGTEAGGTEATVDAALARIPPRLLKRILAYLAKVEPAVSGQCGHDGTFWPARAVCWGFDLGKDTGFAVLWRHFNPRCKPTWSEADLRHKCENADEPPFNKERGWLLDQEPGDEVHATDVGNARRVVERHGQDLRYCWPWRTWLTWDSKRWAEDLTGEAVRRVKETQADLFRWAVKRIEELGDTGDGEEAAAEKKRAKALLAHALKWEDARAISRCLELARSEPAVPVLPAGLDGDPMLFNVANGTIDLRSGELRPHRSEDLITKLANVAYDTDAKCPLWEGCLSRWMDGNGDLVTYLQRVVGYGLTGDVREQCLWFLYGLGANGKSTFLTTILAMMGDYAMQAVSDLLMVKHNESHPTERADLLGKRFVATIETEEGKRMAEALMKQLTGGDKVRARKMRQDFFEFPQTWKIALAANHKPVIRGTDHASWRRIKLVPFTVTIPDEKKDKELPEKLKAELPGILAWAVRGCLDWRREGLAEPDEVRQATAAYQSEQDTVQAFLNECCILQRDAKVRASALLEAYHEWSGDKLMTAPAFRKRLQDKGFENKRGQGGWYLWHGIGLIPNGPQVKVSEGISETS